MNARVPMKFRIGSILALPLLLIVLSSCSGGGKSANLSEYTKVYENSYASGFSILGVEGSRSTIITVTNPWQGADSIVTRLFISRNGESAPAHFDGQILNGDAKRIVTMSSTHIALLDAVGGVNTIVGVSGRDFVSNADIRAKGDAVGDVGYEGNVDYERLASLRPDIVLLYGVGAASQMETKLKALSIPFMYVGDYMEESPLGKAEWMVVMGELIGNRNDAQKKFAMIPPRYEALKKVVDDAGVTPVKVMVNTPYGDSWFMPSTFSYAVRLISDAGGEYLYPQNNSTSSVPIDIEVAYTLVSKADRWINTGSTNTLAELKSLYPKFVSTPVVSVGEVYNCTARTNTSGGNDYWESGIVKPDTVLRDLINIFHPGLLPDTALYYYRKL